MAAASQAMKGRGYVMLGYSQFVSPQAVWIAKTNSLKWARGLGASAVLQEKPVRSGQRNFGYLATFWAKRKASGLGVLIQDLPPDILKTMGEENNVVMVDAVFDDSPASAAGLRMGDALLALNGERILNAKGLKKRVGKSSGKEVILTISRKGDEEEIRLKLNEKTDVSLLETGQRGSGEDPPAGDGEIAFHDQPWLKTRPTDWSFLGKLGDVSQAIGELNQKWAEERRIERERAEAQYQRNLAHYDSLRRERQSKSRIMPGGSGRVPSGRGMTKQQYSAMMDKWRQSDYKRQQKQRTQALKIWWGNAPSIYLQMYKFPKRRAF